jgi:hypothetical protein
MSQRWEAAHLRFSMFDCARVPSTSGVASLRYISSVASTPPLSRWHELAKKNRSSKQLNDPVHAHCERTMNKFRQKSTKMTGRGMMFSPYRSLWPGGKASGGSDRMLLVHNIEISYGLIKRKKSCCLRKALTCRNDRRSFIPRCITHSKCIITLRTIGTDSLMFAFIMDETSNEDCLVCRLLVSPLVPLSDCILLSTKTCPSVFVMRYLSFGGVFP